MGTFTRSFRSLSVVVAHRGVNPVPPTKHSKLACCFGLLLVMYWLIHSVALCRTTLHRPDRKLNDASRRSKKWTGEEMKTKRTNRSSPNYETFLSGSHNVVRNSEESNQQQVIILAGPHKTASSSIQYNLMRWFGDTNDTLGLQIRWSFDSPIKTFQEQGCVSALRYPYQVFYWLVQAILENPTKCRSNELTGEIIYTREEMLELYTRRFRESWSRGKSIIIATEAIDTQLPFNMLGLQMSSF